MQLCPTAIAALVASVCVCVSCGEVSPKKMPEAAADLPPAHVDPATSGEIRGVVRYRGPKPVMPAIDFSSNPQCERDHPKPVRAETVVVNPNGTLRNTLVWIKSGLPKARWEPPSEAVKLDQVGCIYKPHVLGVMVNQELEILNSDPVNHDVHVEAAINPASNESEPPRAETLHKRYAAEEVWFPVTCSVHPWMRSYVAVVSHPFFAVTGPDGSYELKGVPPGTYVVETVQERFGRKEQQVKVEPRGLANMDFVYAE